MKTFVCLLVLVALVLGMLRISDVHSAAKRVDHLHRSALDARQGRADGTHTEQRTPDRSPRSEYRTADWTHDSTQSIADLTKNTEEWTDNRTQETKERNVNRTEDVDHRPVDGTQDTRQRTLYRTEDVDHRPVDGTQDTRQRTLYRTKNMDHRPDDGTQDTGQWAAERTSSPNSSCYSLCRCIEKTADCSRNYGRLTFVPELPEGIQFLNFSYNNLSSVPTDDFFLNVTNITGLDLGNNGLRTISPGAFRPLSQLVTLLLAHNKGVTLDSLRPVLEIRDLQYLDLRHNALPAPPADLFIRYPLLRLEILYLHENFFHNINMSLFTPLPSLRYLGLANNGISFLSTQFFPVLSTLHLGQNNLHTFPATCQEHGGASLFPNLTRLLLLSNQLSTIEGEVCLPSLKDLDLQRNHFHVFYSDQFSDARFPSLQQLDLASMRTKNGGIQKHAFRSTSLQVVTLMFNNINVSTAHNDSFAGMPSVRTLQLSHNYFETVSAGKFVQLFGNLTTLNRLYICAARLKVISVEMLKSLESLTHLSLCENHIPSLPDGVVDGHVNLTDLNLDSNQIAVVKETTFSPATRHRLQRLDLSNNPFDCSCDLRWFQGWLASGPVAMSHSRYKYTCSNLPDTNVTSFYLSQQACLLSRASSVQLVYSLSLLLLLLTTAGLLYRYRWHLRLLLYEALRGGGEARRRRLQRGQFQYDVYVSYASQDLRWVRQTLLAELERWGLRLCLHDRDFLVDDISQSVQSSKKVLVVFSRHYSRDQWCQFELHFCLRHVMEFGDQLLVTCLHDAGPRDLTAAMMAVVKMTSYIRWAEEEDAMAAFWGRVAQGLWEILPPDFHP